MKKKLLSALLSVAMVSALLAGCGSSSSEGTTDAGTASEEAPAADDAAAADTTAEEAPADTAAAGEGRVYFLNFKPESAEIWEEVMQVYSDETGVPATVLTAAAGTYEQTLKSEVAKTEAPTLFQINGPVGYQSWKDYTLDLKDTGFYEALSDKTLAITDGDGVYGIPYAIEGYGIIYNNKILSEYFAMDGAKAKSVDEINSFAKLKEVAQDIQAKKDDLGISGAFASTSFAPGEDWRWQTHLANLPLYYEYKDKGVADSDTVDGTYFSNYKDVFDLYINNSSTEPGLLSSKTVADSMSEFALGEVAFVQNGDWAWGDIQDNEVAAEDVKYLPIYIGMKGEENQGLCIGTENYWCVNSQASEADQKATLDFVDWLLNSDTGKDYMVNKLGFTAPFTTFGANEAPANPLSKAIVESTASGKEAVSWAFNTMPSQTFKNNLGAALLEYAQGTGDWAAVESAFKDGWAKEKANPTPEE